MHINQQYINERWKQLPNRVYRTCLSAILVESACECENRQSSFHCMLNNIVTIPSILVRRSIQNSKCFESFIVAIKIHISFLLLPPPSLLQLLQTRDELSIRVLMEQLQIVHFYAAVTVVADTITMAPSTRIGFDFFSVDAIFYGRLFFYSSAGAKLPFSKDYNVEYNRLEWEKREGETIWLIGGSALEYLLFAVDWMNDYAVGNGKKNLAMQWWCT